jgi:hypothetical protein
VSSPAAGTADKHPPRPEALPVLPENIPSFLKEGRKHVVWRYELRQDNKGQWKCTKPPFRPDGRNASSTDPATWVTFAEALAAYQAGGWDGIGRVLVHEEDLVGADCDKCLDPKTGAVEEWAAAIIKTLNTYTEVSPGGHGFRIFLKGKLPPHGRKKDKFECYNGTTLKGEPGGRYVTLTGQHSQGTPRTIEDRTEQMLQVHGRIFAKKSDTSKASKPRGRKLKVEGFGGDCPLPLTADELARWNCLRTSKADRIKTLWGGDVSAYDDDDSSADLALCAYLIILTNGDRTRAEQLFGESALGQRAKWKDRQDYRDRTFAVALEGFQPWKDDPAVKGGTSRPTPGTAVAIILAYWRECYDLTFRRGGAVYSSALGRELRVGELLVGAPSDLIDRLASAREAPRTEQGEAVRAKLPALFRTWAPTAWADLLAALPEESSSEEIPEQARESFRAAVTRALLTVVALQYRHGRGKADDKADDVQRRPLIDWARQFAREGVWGDVRGLRLWSRLAGGLLRVRLRVEVFSQVHAVELARLTPNEFTRLAEQYGVGVGCKVQGGNVRAVEMAPDYLTEVLAVPSAGDGQDRSDRKDRTDGDTCAHARESVLSDVSDLSAQGGVYAAGTETARTETAEGREGAQALFPDRPSDGGEWL